MNQEKNYTLDDEEDSLQFIRRVINDQADRERLRIVEQLVEIAVGEVKDCLCGLSAVATEKCLTVTVRHGGKRMDGRLLVIMRDYTDRVDYHPDGDKWVLTIYRYSVSQA